MAKYSIECHYTKCDVCGDGQDVIYVHLPESTGDKWVVGRKSNCFGHESWELDTSAETLSKMDEQKFLLATRYSKQRFKAVRHIAQSYEPPPSPAEVAQADRRISRNTGYTTSVNQNQLWTFTAPSLEVSATIARDTFAEFVERMNAFRADTARLIEIQDVL